MINGKITLKYEIRISKLDYKVFQSIANSFKVSTHYPLDRTDTLEPTIKPQKDDEAEFQAFMNDPELGVWYKKLPKSSEEKLRKLRAI